MRGRHRLGGGGLENAGVFKPFPMQDHCVASLLKMERLKAVNAGCVRVQGLVQFCTAASSCLRK